MKKTLLTLLLLFTLKSTLVASSMVLDHYYQFKDMKQFKDYITGVGKGIYIANHVMGAYKEVKLFCPPDSFDPTQPVVLELLDNQIKNPGNMDFDGTTSLELITTLAYIVKFPCK